MIYDSGDEIWDLDHPFDYYPGNPVEMNCRFLARWEEDPNARAEINFWRIDIIYDLNGGHWGSEFEGLKQLMAPEWQSIPLDALKRIEPTREGYRFSGWSVRFSNPVNGYVIYDSGQEVWNLDVPFNYYPDNPPEMDCRFFARWVVDALPPDPDAESWSVIVSHDLNGGHWGAVSIDPHVLMAPVGQSMPPGGLDQEKSIEPIKVNASFRGWSVRFTDSSNGNVIYDSGNEVWDLYHPFDYYPNNPSHNLPFRDKQDGLFKVVTRIWKDEVRIEAICSSPDFINWSAPHEIIRGSGFESQVYSMPVFWYDGIYLGLASMFHEGDRSAANFDTVDLELTLGITAE